MENSSNAYAKKMKEMSAVEYQRRVEKSLKKKSLAWLRALESVQSEKLLNVLSERLGCSKVVASDVLYEAFIKEHLREACKTDGRLVDPFEREYLTDFREGVVEWIEKGGLLSALDKLPIDYTALTETEKDGRMRLMLILCDYTNKLGTLIGNGEFELAPGVDILQPAKRCVGLIQKEGVEKVSHPSGLWADVSGLDSGAVKTEELEWKVEINFDLLRGEKGIQCALALLDSGLLSRTRMAKYCMMTHISVSDPHERALSEWSVKELMAEFASNPVMAINWLNMIDMSKPGAQERVVEFSVQYWKTNNQTLSFLDDVKENIALYKKSQFVSEEKGNLNVFLGILNALQEAHEIKTAMRPNVKEEIVQGVGRRIKTI